MNEEQNITIRIANQPPVAMTIPRDEEEVVRTAERSVNQLWEAWCRRFDNRTPAEVLAMVAFQFARLYYGDREAMDAVDKRLSAVDKELDALLLDMDE